MENIKEICRMDITITREEGDICCEGACGLDANGEDMVAILTHIFGVLALSADDAEEYTAFAAKLLREGAVEKLPTE